MARMPDEFTLGKRPSLNTTGGMSRYQPSGSSEVVGIATAKLGRDISSGLSNVEKAIAMEQERVDILRAEDAYNKAVEERMNLMYNQEDGLITIKGEDAVKTPVVQNFRDRYRMTGDKLRSGLGNDRQRELFNKRFEIAELQLTEDALRHTATQRGVYEEQVYNATMATQIKAAAHAWKSPNDIAIARSAIVNQVLERSESQGWSPQAELAEKQVQLGKLHAMVINQMLANGEMAAAEKWFDDYTKDADGNELPAELQEIDPETKADLAKVVANGEQKQEYHRLGYAYIVSKSQDDKRWQMAMLQGLETEIVENQIIDESQRNTLLGQVTSRMEMLQKQMATEYDRWTKDMEKRLGEIEDMAVAGFLANVEQVQAILDETKGTPLEGAGRATARFNNTLQRFVNEHPAVMRGMLDKYMADLGDNPSPDDVKIATKLETLVEKRRKLLAENPASYANRHLYDEPVNIDFRQPETQQAQFAEAFARAESLTATHGAPYKPLTEDMAQMLKSHLESLPYDGKGQYLAQLWAGSGGNVKGYTMMLRQIAGDMPLVAMAGEKYAKGDPDTSRLMLRGAAILTGDNGKSQLPMPNEQEMRIGYTEYIGDAFAGNPPARNAHYEAARAIYAALVSKQGLEPEELHSDLWEEAMLRSTGGRMGADGELEGGVLDYNGAKIQLPMNIGEEEFHVRVRAALGKVSNMEGVLEKDVGDLEDLPLKPGPRDGTYYVMNGPDFLTRLEPDDVRTGELGVLYSKDGKVMTEYSITIQLPDGTWANVPTLVQGQVEVQEILNGMPLTQAQQEHARNRAMQRVKEGGVLPTFKTKELALEAAINRPEREKYKQGGKTQVPVMIDLNTELTDEERRAAERYTPKDVSEFSQESERVLREQQSAAESAPAVPTKAQQASAEYQRPPDEEPAKQQRPPFTPDSRWYDYETAEARGYTADASGHWPTLSNVTTEEIEKYNLPPMAGMFLKGRKHPTFNKSMAEEYMRGNAVIKRGDRWFSVPYEWAFNTPDTRMIWPNIDALDADTFARYSKWLETK